MDRVAYLFSDLFGKDVIYSPLTVEEMTASLEGMPGATAFAQMCLYLGSDAANRGDVKETREIMVMAASCFGGGNEKEPQTFQDWLLTHSDEEGFERMGLTRDGEWLLEYYDFCLC